LGFDRVIPISVDADWYARRVGVAAAREINTIPARRPSTEQSILRRAGMRRTALPAFRRHCIVGYCIDFHMTNHKIYLKLRVLPT
jgi:hypothetical protein